MPVPRRFHVADAVCGAFVIAYAATSLSLIPMTLLLARRRRR